MSVYTGVRHTHNVNLYCKITYHSLVQVKQSKIPVLIHEKIAIYFATNSKCYKINEKVSSWYISLIYGE